MVKKDKTQYLYNDEKLRMKEIYKRSKKRRNRSQYLFSVFVTIKKDSKSIPTKLMYVHTKSNRKDWLILISTDTGLSEEGIIRIYGKHWNIEVSFKEYKSLSEPCERVSWHFL